MTQGRMIQEVQETNQSATEVGQQGGEGPGALGWQWKEQKGTHF